MEGGGRSRLSRLLNRLRGYHHNKYYLDKGISFCSSTMSESTACGTNSTTKADVANNEDDFQDFPVMPSTLPVDATDTLSDDDHCDPTNDLRYGGQYMTAEQLPAFCDQLSQLIEIIRNIQSYSHVTGEYPAELERRLEHEAREVACLAAEARNARDVIERTRLQRRALRDQRTHLAEHLLTLKDTEIRELETSVRLSDRKLYKTWESLKDSVDPVAFEPLLEEIRNKQTALECLVRLIDSRRALLFKTAASPQPLPSPMPKDTDESSTLSGSAGGVRKRVERRAAKRRRKEPRSVPLSTEPSAHAHLPQVTLFIQGSDTAGRRNGSVPLTPLELPSGGSVRDILFFTAHQT